MCDGLPDLSGAAAQRTGRGERRERIGFRFWMGQQRERNQRSGSGCQAEGTQPRAAEDPGGGDGMARWYASARIRAAHLGWRDTVFAIAPRGRQDDLPRVLPPLL